MVFAVIYQLNLNSLVMIAVNNASEISENLRNDLRIANEWTNEWTS